MATRPGKVVTYNEEFSSIKSNEQCPMSNDPLIKWSSGFDFSYKICRCATSNA